MRRDDRDDDEVLGELKASEAMSSGQQARLKDLEVLRFSREGSFGVTGTVWVATCWVSRWCEKNTRSNGNHLSGRGPYHILYGL